jgi:hypothetical protein
LSKPIPKPRHLLKETFKSFRNHWGKLVLIALVIGAPTGLVTLFLGAADSELAPYLSLAAVLMNLALIWSIMQLDKGERVTIKRAYYEGGTAVVRFFLVTITLALMLFPLMIGAIVFAAGVVGEGVTVSVGEQVLLGVVWLLLSFPTMFWLTRYLLSLITVVAENHTPVQALRASKKLVKGRSWTVAGRLAALGLVSLLVLALPAILLSIVVGSEADVSRASLQLFTTTIILPFSYLYLYKLYQALK